MNVEQLSSLLFKTWSETAGVKSRSHKKRGKLGNSASDLWECL